MTIERIRQQKVVVWEIFKTINLAIVYLTAIVINCVIAWSFIRYVLLTSKVPAP